MRVQYVHANYTVFYSVLWAGPPKLKRLHRQTAARPATRRFMPTYPLDYRLHVMSKYTCTYITPQDPSYSRPTDRPGHLKPSDSDSSIAVQRPYIIPETIPCIQPPLHVPEERRMHVTPEIEAVAVNISNTHMATGPGPGKHKNQSGFPPSHYSTPGYTSKLSHGC
ncbi:hypothetical protein BCR34DRAFT_78428 [Clohesyomyces aquaticus]|uniref:Uncharacterized protein n=1 Tax=Clohesyomyces aquaticus TaxID=1231657 RepID=A0A1Y1YY58_9PLEO|nr:hypothetical protein BCR34DRAFT_78428 [Clohesyomyces aquaticus]